MRLNKIWERTTVRGHIISWKTWPLWNKGNKPLLSETVQGNASKKNEPYWTDGQTTALSCTIARPTDIHQHLTVRRQTGRLPHPSQRRGGYSTITEEREVRWNRQHPSRTGPRRWRGSLLKSRTEHHRADLKPRNPLWEVPAWLTGLKIPTN